MDQTSDVQNDVGSQISSTQLVAKSIQVCMGRETRQMEGAFIDVKSMSTLFNLRGFLNDGISNNSRPWETRQQLKTHG